MKTTDHIKSNEVDCYKYIEKKEIKERNKYESNRKFSIKQL